MTLARRLKTQAEKNVLQVFHGRNVFDSRARMTASRSAFLLCVCVCYKAD